MSVLYSKTAQSVPIHMFCKMPRIRELAVLTKKCNPKDCFLLILSKVVQAIEQNFRYLLCCFFFRQITWFREKEALGFRTNQT